MSSRSASLAPEPAQHRAADSRAGSRPPELFVKMFPEESDDSDDSPTSKYQLNLPENGSENEFYVPLPLHSRVKNQYEITVDRNRRSMEAFILGSQSAEVVRQMRELVSHLDNVCTHIDLENEDWERTQQELAEDQAKWALISSSKFVFLNHVCNHLRDQAVHVAIVAKEPRTLFLLERFMQASQIDHVRPDSGKRTFPDHVQSLLKVSLIGSGPGAQLGPWPSKKVLTNLVIAFDGSFDVEARHIRTLRNNPASPGGLAPVVYPLVYCSAEHLRRCIENLDALKTDADRLRALIVSISEREDDVGEMQLDDFKADAAGEEVGQFVLNGGTKANWSVLPIRPVKVMALEGVIPDELSPGPAEATAPNTMSSPTRKRPSEVRSL